MAALLTLITNLTTALNSIPAAVTAAKAALTDFQTFLNS